MHISLGVGLILLFIILRHFYAKATDAALHQQWEREDNARWNRESFYSDPPPFRYTPEAAAVAKHLAIAAEVRACMERVRRARSEQQASQATTAQEYDRQWQARWQKRLAKEQQRRIRLGLVRIIPPA